MKGLPAMKADVAIVLLNWNGWRDTLECLDSLTQLNYGYFSIIVVDNDSTDGSREHILDWSSKRHGQLFGISSTSILSELDLDAESAHELQHGDFVYIQASSNGGYAAGNNLGIDLAIARQANYVWLLNNDTVVDANSLCALLHKISSSNNIGICGSVLRYFSHPDTIQAIGGVKFNYWMARGRQLGQGLHANDCSVQEIAKCVPDYIAGASMLVTREFLQDVGLMEESYFLYFEEIDWAVRAQPRWKLAIAADSIVYHKEGGAIGTASIGRRSVLSQYYLIRNLLRFYAIRLPVLLPIAFARAIREVVLQLYKRDWELAHITIKAIMAAKVGERGKSKLI